MVRGQGLRSLVWEGQDPSGFGNLPRDALWDPEGGDTQAPLHATLSNSRADAQSSRSTPLINKRPSLNGGTWQAELRAGVEGLWCVGGRGGGGGMRLMRMQFLVVACRSARGILHVLRSAHGIRWLFPALFGCHRLHGPVGFHRRDRKGLWATILHLLQGEDCCVHQAAGRKRRATKQVGQGHPT